MKRIFMMILCALAAAASITGGVARAETAETIAGELAFVPRPDVSLCFCGSYLLVSESGAKDVYLVAADLDLALYVGARVTVEGRPYTAICSGTLALPCSYFAVEKIVPATRADADPTSWGAVKALYR